MSEQMEVNQEAPKKLLGPVTVWLLFKAPWIPVFRLLAWPYGYVSQKQLGYITSGGTSTKIPPWRDGDD